MWLLLGGNGPGGWLVASHCCFPVVVVVGAARQFAGQVHAGTEGCATFDSLLFRLWLPLPRLRPRWRPDRFSMGATVLARVLEP